MAQNSRILPPLSLLCLCLFISSCVPKKQVRPEFLAQLGDSAFANDDRKEAEKLYLRALKATPRNISIRLKLLRLYLHQKNFIGIFKLTENMPLTLSTLDAIRIRAVAYDLTGCHEKAQEIYKQILKLSPTDEKSHMNIMLSYQLTHNEPAMRNHKIKYAPYMCNQLKTKLSEF